MKVRCGFVTNSSSSSYVVARKGIPNEVMDLIEKYPILKPYIMSVDTLLDGDIIYNAKELNQKMDEDWGLKADIILGHIQGTLTKDEKSYWSSELQTYDKYMEYIKNGMNITMLEIDNNNESLMEKIKDMDDGVNIIVECEY